MAPRSRRIVVLSLMGASAFALAACQDDTVEASVHTTPEACVAAGGEAVQCRAEYDLARATHADTAPRYDAMDVCEQEHGPGQCQTTEVSDGSGGMMSAVMPLMAGYMMGQMLSSNRTVERERERGGSGAAGFVAASRVAPKPLYGVAKGGYASADGALRTNSLSGKMTTSPSAFAKPATTRGVAPMTRATVSSRGGFGAARSSMGG